MKTRILQCKKAVLPTLLVLLLSVVGMTKAMAQASLESNLNHSINNNEASLSVIGHVADTPSHSFDFDNGSPFNNDRLGEGGWFYYDNGQLETAMGTGGSQFWWGVKFPAGSYYGNMITKVAAYDYMAMTGTVTIYNDGDNAPATPVGQTNVTFTGAANFVEFEFADTVFIDPTENLWVIFYNESGAAYPAAVCASTGDANGRYVSLNGVDWDDAASYGLNYTWMVRAYLVVNEYGEDVQITATATPSEGGTISGEGTYQQGQICTLTATAEEGYTFMYWTEGDRIVSAESDYNFLVACNRDLVAHFALPFSITALTDPEEAGMVSGEGSYDYGDTCTLTATANSGYIFANWTKDDAIVSTDMEYSFIVADSATFMAHFVPEDNIVFADANVKSICISHWDTNDDGELSYFEAASVTDLSNYFRNNTEITSFNELQYFIGLSSISANAFSNCNGLTYITLPPFVTSIGNYAFYNCSSYSGQLTIGNAVTSIGNYAFYGCRSLTGSINIPNSVITIGNYAFQGCSALSGSLTIGNAVTSIGSAAFSGCTGLVGDIVIPNSVTIIGDAAFYDCYGLTGNLVIPNSVISIGSSAFYNCHGFTGTLTIGSSVTSIGSSAFERCSSFVGNIVIPNSVNTIGSYAFYNCNSFSGYLSIPSSVTTIGGSAFYYCSGLSQVNYNVTNHADINDGSYNYPFQGCNGHLIIGDNVARIPRNMFRNANFTGILTIPNSVIQINDNAFNNCWRLTGTLVIPNSVNTIGISAFQNCNGLSEIIMGNNVTTVGNTAFYSCSGLTKVTLPESVTEIGTGAFSECTQLNTVNMQSTQAPSIGEGVFANNATDRIINIPCETIENYSDGNWSEWTDALNEICDDFEIAVMIKPAIAGSATGAGNYSYGEMCTLTAIGNMDYVFLNWTKNGVVVSTEATYSFGVTESCTYEANFYTTLVSYDINVAVNPAESGSVIGGGSYHQGVICTLIAVANEGYIFANWTKDGVEVSTDASYSFTVTEDAIYIANFIDAPVYYNIIATANPEEGGTVSGAGNYEEGQTCTLIAMANEGYNFANWTKDGVEVSTDASYSFTVTEDATYIANFIDAPVYYNIIATANPEEGGTVSGAGNYEEGQTCTLIAMANDGYTFVNWTKDSVEVSTNDTCSFIVTEDATFVANFIEDQQENTQVSNFSQGYNWWCSYIEQSNINGLGMLEESLGDNGVSIRSQANGYTDYYQGYGWFGSLSHINNESSYRVITSEPCTVTMTGNTAVPSEHPITLSQGWTWIGYVPSTTMSVDVAMAGLEATAGDKLKSQQGYSDYYPGYGWFGSLNTIEPGMGLMYYSANDEVVTLTYPDNNRRGELKANLTSENNHWKPSTFAYPDNMTVMAVVDLNGEELKSEHYELSAFASNGECRGSVKLTYAEPLNRYVAFLTISGKDATELSFRLYDKETGMEYYDAEESFDFVANAIVGEADDLYTIHFRGTTGMDEFANRVKVYPNPVNVGEQFSIGLSVEDAGKVHVEIVNTLGVIETLRATSVQTLTAPNVAGVYSLRITMEGKGTIVRKLVVK